MLKYIIKRLLLMIPVILGITVLIFTIMHFAPGDTARIIAGNNASPEQLEAVRESLGLNDPFLVQLGRYMKDLFLHFDLGTSAITGIPVAKEIMNRFPYTLTIALLCTILSLVIGLPLGIIAATNQYSWKDNLSMFLALIGSSMPSFWLALILSLIFALNLRLLPATGVGTWKHYVLPVLTTSVSGIALMARQTRSNMLEVIRSDYVVTARAKGQNERVIVYRHALQNALIPVITVCGTWFGMLLAGSMITEIVFSIPGLGVYIYNGIVSRDYMVVESTVIFVAIVFGFVLLGVDILYAFIDPRIKAQFVTTKKKAEAKEEKDE